MMQQTAVLVLAHGSRLHQVEEAVGRLAAQVGDRLGVDMVQPAFLNFNQPGLAEGVAALVGRGAQRIVVVPVFLNTGVHIQQDIPAQLAEVQDTYRGRVQIIAAGNLAGDPRIAEIVADRVREAAGWIS